MEEKDVPSILQPVVRYFNNRRPGVFDLVRSGELVIDIQWHEYHCGKVWGDGSGRIMVKSRHITLKRRNAYGRDTIISSNQKKAIEVLDTYIRVPSADAILDWATNGLSNMGRERASEVFVNARAPIREFINDNSVLENLSYMLNGMPDAIRNKMAPLLEPLEEAEKLKKSTESDASVCIAHDKKDDAYYIRSGSGSKRITKRVTVLPEALHNKLAVLRVCDAEKLTPVGIWKKLNDIVDSYHIFGETLDASDTRK